VEQDGDWASAQSSQHKFFWSGISSVDCMHVAYCLSDPCAAKNLCPSRPQTFRGQVVLSTSILRHYLPIIFPCYLQCDGRRCFGHVTTTVRRIDVVVNTSCLRTGYLNSDLAVVVIPPVVLELIGFRCVTRMKDTLPCIWQLLERSITVGALSKDLTDVRGRGNKAYRRLHRNLKRCI
jgi:hypothetical protein